MNAFTIGLSALAAGRRGLDLTGQNIANASTPGYTRKAANLAMRSTDGVTGSGVDISTITRYNAPSVQAAWRRSQSDQSSLSARLDIRQQVETAIPSGNGGIADQAEAFFNSVGQLTSRSDDATARVQVLTAAKELANQFHTAANGIDEIRVQVGQQANQTVSEINDYAKSIADFNHRISAIEAGGGQALDLRDQRDQVINNLSQRIDIRTVDQANGIVNVLASNAAIVVGDYANQFTSQIDGNRKIVINETGSTRPVTFDSGSLGGLLKEYNTDLPDTRQKLDTLANGIMQQIDQVQATGLNSSGPLSVAYGSRGVTDASAPLAGQTSIQPGQLIISLTDTATGNRTNTTVAIDPATQSLQDVASSITSATGGKVQATVNTNSNTLEFRAQSGTTFDFAGRTTNPPSNVIMNGTSVPRVGGLYTGSTNDTYSFNISGSGTVGVTPGLSVQVRDSGNNTVATVNVGAGYAPGTPIAVGNGITVTLGAGTTSNGSFSAPMIANSDSSNMLSNLGVNSLFSGKGADGISVRSDILDNPTRLNASRTGDSGENSNLLRFAAARDQATFNNGTRTFSQSMTDLSTQVGATITGLDDAQVAQASVTQELFGQEQSVAGVDMNEEVVKMLDYQRLIQSASKYISTVNDTLDSILAMIR